MKTIAALFLILLGGLVGWHYHTAFDSNVVSIIDPSASITQNCLGIVDISVLSRPELRDRSRLTLLAMGRGVHDTEPKVLLNRPFPMRPNKVIGKDEKGFEREWESFRKAVQDACEGTGVTDQSPILSAVRAAVSHLRSQKCTANGKCFLVMKTDLEEDVEPSLKAAVGLILKGKPAELPVELARSIDNAGINIEFCGISETSPRRDRLRANPDALSRLWRNIFTHSQLVSIKPFCGGA